MINAYQCFLKRKSTTNGSKKDKAGNYQDEIVIFDDFAVWLYHANPIAMLDYKTGELTLGNCGWPSKTTKERLNSLPFVHILQKNCEWFNADGTPFEDKSKRIKERIKGGAQGGLPCFCVAWCADTGMWDDSWYPSDKVKNDLDNIKAFFARQGISVNESTEQTGNFSINHYLTTKGTDYKKAREVMVDFTEPLAYAHLVTED